MAIFNSYVSLPEGSGIYRLPTDGTKFSHTTPTRNLNRHLVWEDYENGGPITGGPSGKSPRKEKREREIGRHSDESVLDLLTSSLAIYICLNDLKCVRVCVYVYVYIYISVCVNLYMQLISAPPISGHVSIWANYNNSLTWILRPFGDDFPY